MGMYMHIHVSPTTDPKLAKVEMRLIHVDHHGVTHPFTAFHDNVQSREYNEVSPIEHWVISTLCNVSSGISSAMLGRLVQGSHLLIPPADKGQRV